MGSVAAGHGLSCSIAWGIFSDQGSNSSPALADGFFPTEPPGEPHDATGESPPRRSKDPAPPKTKTKDLSLRELSDLPRAHSYKVMVVTARRI